MATFSQKAILVYFLGCVEFSDVLYECTCGDEEDEICAAALEFVKTASDCDESLGMEWVNRLWNFDDIFQSTHTLFTVATLSGKVYACVCFHIHHIFHI